MFGIARQDPTPAARPAPGATGWLVFVATLPTTPEARMKVLRTLETLGAGMLREGAYVLPASAQHAAAFERLATYVRDSGGGAWLLRGAPVDATERDTYIALFDRSARWRDLAKDIAAMKTGFGMAEPAAIAKVLQRLRDAFDALAAVDFFPTAEQATTAAVLAEVEQAVKCLRAPDQPGARGMAPLRERRKYFRRMWATRRPLGIDRLASAWLVRRFVDPEATLVWLAKNDVQQEAAVTFAFEGAEFDGSRSRCCFEELLSAFGLDDNRALRRIGGLVHHLEAGDLSVAEASGIESMIAGARRRTSTDDGLLAEVEQTFDMLYDRYFKVTAPKSRV